MVLMDLVGNVSAVGDTDAMVAGDSGSKHNGGRSAAVCAVNSMVSEASAATVAVLDVIGGVSAGMVTNATVAWSRTRRWHGHERDVRTQVAAGSSVSGVASDIDSRVSDTMEVTVALVDVVSGVSADMDTDADAMVAGDSGSKHNGGRSAAVCAVNSMVSEASAATVAVLDVIGGVSTGMVTNATVAWSRTRRWHSARAASATTAAVRTQVAAGSSVSGVASDIDSRVSDTMEVTVALVDVVSGVSADMDTDADAMVAGDSGSKHNGGRSAAVCAVNSMVSEASAATVAVLDVIGGVSTGMVTNATVAWSRTRRWHSARAASATTAAVRTQVAAGSSVSGVASDIDSRVSDTMEVTVALVDVVSGVSADMDTDADAMVAGDSGSKHNGGRSAAVCAVNSMVSEASAATVAVLDVIGGVSTGMVTNATVAWSRTRRWHSARAASATTAAVRTQVAAGSSVSGVASDIDSRVSDTMEVTVALVDVVSGVSADMDTDADAMVAGDSGSKHNGGRSAAVCAVNSMVSEASAATVAVLDVIGGVSAGMVTNATVAWSRTRRWHGHERDVRTQVAAGSSVSGVASDIDSRVSDTMEVTVALVDVVSGVSADMDTDADAMVAGDSGSKHNGGRSAAVCAVNSMVSEASAATVAVLDVIGGVSTGMVTNATVAFGSGSERNDSGSPHAGCCRDIDSRVSDTMEVTVALVDVVSGVSADMDTDADAMVAGDSGSKHNGGRSAAVCAVNSMVSEASAATVAVLDVIGGVSTGMVTNATVAWSRTRRWHSARAASATTAAARTQVAAGNSVSGVASDIDSRVSDTMEVTVALVDVVSGVSADMDTDADAMVAGDSGSKHNGGRSAAVCAVNSMVSEASAATVAVLDVIGGVSTGMVTNATVAWSRTRRWHSARAASATTAAARTQVAAGNSVSGVASDIDSRVSDTMEVTVALVDVVSGVSADMDTDADAMVAGDSGSKHNGGRSAAVCAVNSMVSEASAATVAVLIATTAAVRTQVAAGNSVSGVASDIDSRVSDTMEVTVALVDVVSGVSADMDTDADAMVAGDSGSKHNGGRSAAVCAVNSMVSEASAATVAVLDVIGGVSTGMVTNATVAWSRTRRWHSARAASATTAAVRTQVAAGSSVSGVASDIDSRVSDTMEVTVALVDVVSGVSADMDTDADAMVAGDSGSKHNGGRSAAVCAVNSMVSEASAATVAVLDVIGGVSTGMVTNATVAWSRTRRWHSARAASATTAAVRTQVAAGSSVSGVASDIDSRVSDTMEVTVALVDVVSGVSADMDTDADAMVAGDSGSKHNGGRSAAVCAVNSMVSEASAATVAVLDVIGGVSTGMVTNATVACKHNGGRSAAVCAVNSMVSEASAATVAVLDVIGGVSTGMVTNATVAWSRTRRWHSARAASATTAAVRTQVAAGSSVSGVASDIDSRVSDTMEVTVALVDVVSGVSADMDTDADAMVAGDSGSKHNGGRSAAVCAVNSMVSEASAATVAVLDVIGGVSTGMVTNATVAWSRTRRWHSARAASATTAAVRTQVAAGSSVSGVASDIDSRVSDTMEVTVALGDVVSGVSADMDTDADAMVAGDSGSKHNGGRSAAVCAVNSMVSEASAATVAVLDVIGGVSAGMVTNATVAWSRTRRWHGHERDVRTQVAAGSSVSGVASDIDSRVSDTMEVTVALVDVVSGVSADMDTDADAMVAGDSGSKHNGGRSAAVCAVNSMVSEASAATVAVLDVIGGVSTGMVTNATVAWSRTRRWHSARAASATTAAVRTQVAAGSSVSGVASDIDSRVSDTMEVTVALVDVVSGVSADMDTDADAMVAGDSGSKHNGGRSAAVCAVNSMVSEASAATVAVLDVIGGVSTGMVTNATVAWSRTRRWHSARAASATTAAVRTQVAAGSSVSGVASDIDSRVSDTMEVTVALVDVVSGVSADMDTDADAMVAGDSGSKHNGGRSAAVCAVNSMVSEASAATVAVLDVIGGVSTGMVTNATVAWSRTRRWHSARAASATTAAVRTQVAAGSSVSGVASDIDSRVSDTMEVTVALVDVVSGVSADMDTDADAQVAFGSGSERNDSGSPHAGCRRDIDSRVSDTMEVTVALVDVVSGVSADMDTDADAMVAGDSGSKHNGGRSAAVCAVNSMVSEASAATVAVLDVIGGVSTGMVTNATVAWSRTRRWHSARAASATTAAVRTQVAAGSSVSGVASDIDSRVSDTMEVTVALVDVVSGVSADMDTDADAMVAGDSGSKHNGGRSAAVCAVNSMVSEASAATVAVLDVIGGVSAGMVTNATVAWSRTRRWHGHERDVRTQVAAGSSVSGVASDIDSRVSDTMEVTVALVDVVSGVSADMDTDADAMVAGDSGSKHNGGRSAAVCAVNSMVSEASAATVAVLDVIGGVSTGMVTNATVAWSRTRRWHGHERDVRTQVAAGSSVSGVASDIDSRVSDTMEVTVALVDVVSGVSADMDTDADAMVAGDSGSKHNGGRSAAVCAVNSMVSEASAATVAVLDVIGGVSTGMVTNATVAWSRTRRWHSARAASATTAAVRTQVAAGSSVSGVASDIDSRFSGAMEVTLTLGDAVRATMSVQDVDVDVYNG
ncbi:hypothetical protein PHYSODRAFT_320708 [Phytophthora sojae]|uniref:Uncharacterized protein n=1 Tax=Phytophthora sojae (strain P6497) TaxID=1094619 RepID=G4YEC0_PHYSP|nr:hypothetical protein PHYSODRAFT_320708 [Phytophthora sojae]EGZ26827.1 hypothetical protein PHYSODRAFT_320708 [Phytophthora sojae]|eukprot:XP_009514102.1 hypothetical protein PHYSODRAFT_320708 [Phytophthora sojae]